MSLEQLFQSLPSQPLVGASSTCFGLSSIFALGLAMMIWSFSLTSCTSICTLLYMDARHGILRERASIARGRLVRDCGRICAIDCGSQLIETFPQQMHCFKPYLLFSSIFNAFIPGNIIQNRLTIVEANMILILAEL